MCPISLDRPCLYLRVFYIVSIAQSGAIPSVIMCRTEDHFTEGTEGRFRGVDRGIYLPPLRPPPGNPVRTVLKAAFPWGGGGGGGFYRGYSGGGG